MNPQKQFCYSSLYQSCANNHPHPEVVGGGECFAGGGGNEDKIMVWSEPMQLHDGTAVVICYNSYGLPITVYLAK